MHPIKAKIIADDVFTRPIAKFCAKSGYAFSKRLNRQRFSSVERVVKAMMMVGIM
jgi:hypothetical protein